VSIGGWWLSDEADAPRKFQIPAGVTLPPGGFAVFYEAAFNDDLNGVPFSLNGTRGDEVILTATTPSGVFTGYRGEVKFGPAANGVSFGRHRTSTGVDFTALSAPTLGTSVTAASPTNQLALFRTGLGASNAPPRVGPVVISQIMYHPPDVVTPGMTNDNVIEEFIELHNRSAMAMPLFAPAYPTNTWRLRDAVEFDFPTNTSIPGKGHLVVVSFNPATNLAALAQFRARYGSNIALVGPYAGKLDNSGENLELLQPDTPEPPGSPDAGFVPYVLADRVRYADRAPWPASADGLGASLHRINIFAYGNDPANWGAAAALLQPGERDTDGDAMPDSWEINHGLDRTSAADAALDLDGDGLSNLGEYRAGTDPTSAASVLRLSATRVGGAIELRFTVMPGRAYSVWRCYDLPPAGAWTKWVSYSTQTVSTVRVLSDGPVSSNRRRFYRVTTP
jgi:hypothetical protein